MLMENVHVDKGDDEQIQEGFLTLEEDNFSRFYNSTLLWEKQRCQKLNLF